jgi:uncharacterized membrane protein
LTSLTFGTVAASFLASAVEIVEALTIVLAVGITRQWRSSLLGAGAALVVLAVIVATLGPAIVSVVPIDTLRLVVGGLLNVFGLQWLTKAVEREAGLRAKRDELDIYQREVAALRAEPAVPSNGVDWYGFALSFKSVLLEGLEVAFIVLTFGLAAGDIASAAVGAAAAAVLVTVAGALLRRPLERVPENALKLVVGILLTTFGTLWAGEGVGLEWPGGDAAIIALFVGFVAAAGFGVIRGRSWTRRSERGPLAPTITEVQP